MAVDWAKEGRKVSIEEGIRISRTNPNAEVYYRPEQDLPEEQQYALVVEE